MASTTKKSKSEELGSGNHAVVATPSKAEAVRQALSAGMESPTDGVEFIRAQFGIEMDNKAFSLAKSQQKTRDAKKDAKPGRKPRSAKIGGGVIDGNGVVATSKSEAKGDADLLAALEAMKPLVASLGADKVKRLADLLG